MRHLWLVVVAGLMLGACSSSTGTTERERVIDMVVRLNEYWAEAAEEFSFDYQPIAHDRVTAPGPDARCDGEEIAAGDVEGNAVVITGCAEGLLIVYDSEYLTTSEVRLQAVLTHEWGHIVQAQAAEIDAAEFGLPIDAELQADCFSGAWWADESFESVAAARSDVANAGDSYDVPVDDAEAHGTPEERVAAFDLGFAEGPGACISDQLIDVLPDEG